MRFRVAINKRDVLATGMLCLVGLVAVLQVSANAVARIAGLGTGIVPVLLGAALMLAGILWLFDSRLSPDDDVDIGSSKWRDSCGLVSALFAFLILGKYGGLVPATFVATLLFVLGDPRHTWRSAAILAGMSTAVLVAVSFNIPPMAARLFAWA